MVHFSAMFVLSPFCTLEARAATAELQTFALEAPDKMSLTQRSLVSGFSYVEPSQEPGETKRKYLE